MAEAFPPTGPDGWDETLGPDAADATLSWRVEAEAPRLDRYVADVLQDRLSRERVKALIQDGRVAVDGAIERKPSLRLSMGQEVAIALPPDVPLALEPEAIPLPIVYEDDHLLVVDKPVGMLTHPTGRERRGTLVNALLHACQGRLSSINGVVRPGIVHRLDRETEGLLVVAKTDAAHRGLAQQIHDKTARREYRAIVQGAMPGESGTVEAPIGRHPVHRNKMRVDPAGRRAVTHWSVADRLGERFSYVLCRLETGRTHQIRVHMAHIGHPLVGDPLYGTGLEKTWKLPTEGQALQAYRLAFVHPASGEPLRFELPEAASLRVVWQSLAER